MEFQYLLSGITPGHGAMAVHAVNVPVSIAGMDVAPGEIIHMDENQAMCKFPADKRCARLATLSRRIARSSQGVCLKRAVNSRLSALAHNWMLERRGSAGQGSAAPIWGISVDKYLDVADPWPLNPSGELLLGLKFENKRALANVEITAQVPGIAFAEWGPGDMSMSFGYKNPPNPRPQELEDARNRVAAACKATGIAFLESTSPDTIEASIDAGVRITGGGEEAARIGRAYAGRTMPV